MDDFDRYLNDQMKDTDFKKEWDENESRYQRMIMVLRARNEEHLTPSAIGAGGAHRASSVEYQPHREGAGYAIYCYIF